MFFTFYLDNGSSSLVYYLYLKFLKQYLCPKMRSILENHLCTLEKYVFSAFSGWKALYRFTNQLFISHLHSFAFANVKPIWFIHWHEWHIKISHYYHITFYMFLKVCEHKPYIFAGSIFGVYMLNRISCSWSTIFLISK